jgi:C_GCAxxG_C_C family probable redox protein
MIDKISQRAGELFQSGYYCAESVLLAIAESKGIESEFIPRIATGFCGGLARTCGMCGAVSGGVMAISLFTGRNSPSESVLPAYDTVRKLLEIFEASFGSTNCRDLTGCDLGTDKGQNYFKTNNLMAQCTRYTEEATRIVMSLIKEKLGSPITPLSQA